MTNLIEYVKNNLETIKSKYQDNSFKMFYETIVCVTNYDEKDDSISFRTDCKTANLFKSFLLSIPESRLDFIRENKENIRYTVYRFPQLLNYLTPEECTIIRSAKEKADDSTTSFLLWLFSIEDFGNIPDEKITSILSEDIYLNSEKECVFYILFGLRFIKEAEKNNKDFGFRELNRETKADILLNHPCSYKLFESAIDHTPTSIYSILSIYENNRYYKYLPQCVKDSRFSVAKVYNDDYYSDKFKTMSVVATCCNEKNINTSNKPRLKKFASMLHLYGFDYEAILESMENCFDEDGKLLDEFESRIKQKANTETKVSFIQDINTKKAIEFPSEEMRDRFYDVLTDEEKTIYIKL